jgi:hypothetical protein
MSISEWLDVVYKVLMAIFGIWLYLDRRSDKTQLRITKLETQMDDKIDDMESRLDGQLDNHSERLVKVEADLRNQPTHNDLGKLYEEMRKMSQVITTIASGLSKQEGILERVEGQVNRMDTFWRAHPN